MQRAMMCDKYCRENKNLHNGVMRLSVCSLFTTAGTVLQMLYIYIYINELMQIELETLQREKSGIMGEKSVIEELKQKADENVTELQVL